MTDRSLTDRVLAGDPRAVARAISLIEDEAPAAAELVRRLFTQAGHAYLIGVTGPPGAGKSTLVDRLIGRFRADGRTVGVIAVDPTSPFTGGAILGDRVRMQAHAGDEGVFIRSMATRGHLGGLARATSEVAVVLGAAGRDLVLIETVGVGQDEVDVVRTADVSIVTLVPGAGDEVQALKAGIMEIADIFVVNKADRDGADRTVASIEAMLALQVFAAGEWRPPIIKTEATSGAGITELIEAITRFREHSDGSGGQRRRDRAEWRVRELIGQRFLQHVERTVLAPGELHHLLDRLASRATDPYTIVDAILARALGGAGVRHPPAAGTSPENVAAPAFASDDRSDHDGDRGPGGPATPSLGHVGIAVADLDTALAFYRDALGLEVGPPEDVASQQVRARFVTLGSTALELVEPTAPESPIAAFLTRRGPGLHHITLTVEDLAATLARLRARGVRLIDQEPRPGAHGSLIAFVHPASAHGVLVELMQAGDPRPAR